VALPPLSPLTASDAFGTSSFASAGHWSDSLVPHSGSSYLVSGDLLRTPQNNVANYTWQGGTLILGNGTMAGTLMTKATAAVTYTIADLHLNQGIFSVNSGSTWMANTLAGDLTLDVGGGSIVSGFDSNRTTDTLNLNSNISGAGPLAISNIQTNTSVNAFTFNVNLHGSNTYSGTTTLTGNTLTNSSSGNPYALNVDVGAGSSFGTGDLTIVPGANGAMIVELDNASALDAGATVTLGDAVNNITSGNLTFDLNFTGGDAITSLVYNGTTYGPGTYGSAASGASTVLSGFTGTGYLVIVPPGAAALGYTNQVINEHPTAADIAPSNAQNGNYKWFNGPVWGSQPSMSLYSTTNGDLTINYDAKTSHGGCLIGTPRDLSQGALPLLDGAKGFYIEFETRLSDNDPHHWPVVWVMPLEHCGGNGHAARDFYAGDSAGYERWMELDVDEGGLAKSAGAAMTSAISWTGIFNQGGYTAVTANNWSTGEALDRTQVHTFGASYDPVTRQVTSWIDGVEQWQTPVNSSSVPAIAAQQLFYPILSAQHHGADLPYSMYVSGVRAYVPAGTGLPAGWSDTDVGATSPQEGATFNGSTWTVHASDAAGINSGGASDQFNFASQSISGDSSIVAQVLNLDHTNTAAEAGVMYRDGTAANAIRGSIRRSRLKKDLPRPIGINAPCRAT
jgi:hypothetical protein